MTLQTGLNYLSAI